MVNKKMVAIVIIIGILIIGTIVGVIVYNLKNTQSVSEEIEPKEKIEVIKNITVSEKNQNETSSIDNVGEENHENTTTENIDNENTINENDNKENNETKSNTSKNKDEIEQEAINLVKKKWGSSKKNVYFYIEDEVQDGVYIVTVRDDDTTAELKAYRVDVNNKKVKEE